MTMLFSKLVAAFQAYQSAIILAANQGPVNEIETRQAAAKQKLRDELPAEVVGLLEWEG